MGKSELWKKYSVKDGKTERKLVNCPRCGIGYFMADHGDRYACGRCGYTQFKQG